MKIHELAQKTGLTASTIRFYEQAGLLSQRYVQRGPNNYREYALEAIDLLLLIKRMQTGGFTLLELKELLQAYEAGKLSVPMVVELLRQKQGELERQRAELEGKQRSLGQMLAHKVTALRESQGQEPALADLLARLKRGRPT